MKVGMRKPNLKSSVKARTTGRAKRAVKKAVIPGYGKKGMGWVKNPKKAMYNKVYHKTTFGVSDVVKATTGSVRKSSAKSTRTNYRAPSATGSTAPKIAKLEFNLLMKGKPSKVTSIVLGIISLVLMLLSRILGFIVLILAVYMFYDYKHRSKTMDYTPDRELEIWTDKVRAYDPMILKNMTYTDVSKATITIMSARYQVLLKYYDKMSAGMTLTQKEKLELIAASNLVMDFDKYVTYKTSDVRFLPDRIRTKGNDMIQAYMDEEYDNAVRHAQTLKTETGRKNQIKKYKDTVTKNLSQVCVGFEDYMNSKVKDTDFEVKES